MGTQSLYHRVVKGWVFQDYLKYRKQKQYVHKYIYGCVLYLMHVYQSQKEDLFILNLKITFTLQAVIPHCI